jgi:AcrR family transcriptional regulator
MLSMPTSDKSYHHGDLRRALIATGMEVLAESGPASLSLREIARRLGVSHNAPSRHFATRQALLAAIAIAGYEDLSARTANAGERAQSTEEAMVRRGLAYVGFALERPALFRLMFSDQIDRKAYRDLDLTAQTSLLALMPQVSAAYGERSLREATLAAWSMVHGLAQLLIDNQPPPELRAGRSDLKLAEATLRAMAHIISRP